MKIRVTSEILDSLKRLADNESDDANTLQLIVFDNGTVLDSPQLSSFPIYNQTGGVLPMLNGPITAGTLAINLNNNDIGWVQPVDAAATTSFMIQAWLPPRQTPFGYLPGAWINLYRTDVPPTAPGDATPVITIDKHGQPHG